MQDCADEMMCLSCAGVVLASWAAYVCILLILSGAALARVLISQGGIPFVIAP